MAASVHGHSALMAKCASAETGHAHKRNTSSMLAAAPTWQITCEPHLAQLSKAHGVAHPHLHARQLAAPPREPVCVLNVLLAGGGRHIRVQMPVPERANIARQLQLASGCRPRPQPPPAAARLLYLPLERTGRPDQQQRRQRRQAPPARHRGCARAARSRARRVGEAGLLGELQTVITKLTDRFVCAGKRPDHRGRGMGRVPAAPCCAMSQA